MITEGEIYYQENFQVDAYMHQHYGQKVFYTDPSEKDEAWELARKTVRQQFQRFNPHLFENNVQVYTMPQEPPSQQIDKTQSPTNAIIAAILNCQTLDDLNGFKILAGTDKSIQAMYNLHLLKLKNK